MNYKHTKLHRLEKHVGDTSYSQPSDPLIITCCHSGRLPSPQKILFKQLFLDTQFKRKSGGGGERGRRRSGRRRDIAFTRCSMQCLCLCETFPPGSPGGRVYPPLEKQQARRAACFSLLNHWRVRYFWNEVLGHRAPFAALFHPPCILRVCALKVYHLLRLGGVSGIIRPHCYQLFCCFGRRSLHIQPDWFRSPLFSLVSLGDARFGDVQAGWGEKKGQR